MSFFYTTYCTKSLVNQSDHKEETPLRIIYSFTPENHIRSKHFLYHDLTKIDTPDEYGVLGHLLKITYWKNTLKYIVYFECSEITAVNVLDSIFLHENVRR